MANVEELMASIKEYSDEGINDPEAAKAQISKILKTHRPIKLADYQYGFSCKGKKNHRLIVKEENDKTKVREYMKQKNSWSCTSRCSFRQKCNSLAVKIKYGILFAPIQHSDKCDTKDYIFVLKVQSLLEEGKLKEAHGLIVNVKRSAHNASNQFLSTSMFDESALSVTDMGNDSILDQSLANDTTACIDSIIVPSETPSPSTAENVSEHGSSSHKRGSDNTVYSMIIVPPLAKKPKIESDCNETFSLEHPSTFVIKQLCNKLGIEYNYNAYKFWGEIDFQEIAPVSENIITHSFKSQNIYACLSQFFTGKPNSCFTFQQTINTAFYDELIAEGIKSSAEIDEMCTSNTVTEEHLEFICKFLSCGIGIFEDGILKKYGKWETENNDALTLILSFENGFYSVVLDL